MMARRVPVFVLAFWALLPFHLFGQEQSSSHPRPRVVVIGVNGMELDVIRPLLLRGQDAEPAFGDKEGRLRQAPHLSRARTAPAFTAHMFTSTKPEEHGVTGSMVGGITANTNMLKEEPIWSVLSKKRGNRRDGQRSSHFPSDAGERLHDQRHVDSRKELRGRRAMRPKLSEVEGGDAVYPPP